MSANHIIETAQAAVQKQSGSGIQAKVGESYLSYRCQGSDCNLDILETPIYEEPVSSICYRDEYLRTVIDFDFDLSKDSLQTNSYLEGVAVPTIDWGHSPIDTDKTKAIALQELVHDSPKYASSPFILNLAYERDEWDASANFDLTGKTAATERFTIDFQTGAVQNQ